MKDPKDWTIADSLDYMLRVRAKSYAPNTLRGLTAEGKKLIERFGTERSITSITEMDMLEYMTWRTEHLKANSANKAFEHTTNWLRFCVQAQTGMRPDLLAAWRRAPEPPVQKVYVTEERMVDVLRSVEHPRDRILIAGYWYTGLRPMELTGLKLADLDARSWTLTVQRSKVQDEILVPLEPGMVREMSRWLAYYRAVVPVALKGDYYLIPRRGNQSESPAIRRDLQPYQRITEPRRIVRDALLAAGFSPTERLGASVLRQSSAQAMYDALTEEGDPDALDKARAHLGHRSTMTTEGYLNRGRDSELRTRTARRGLLDLPDESEEGVAHATVTDIRSWKRRRTA